LSNKTEEKRTRIIEKGQEIILKKGYVNTSVQDITEALGIAKGSFYTYFKSKDELIIAIIQEVTSYQFEVVKEISARVTREDFSFRDVIDLFSSKFFYFDDKIISQALFLISLAGNIEAVSQDVIEFIKKNRKFITMFWRETLLIERLGLNLSEDEAIRYAFYIQELFLLTIRRVLLNGGSRFCIPSKEEAKVLLNSKECERELSFVKNMILNMVKGEER